MNIELSLTEIALIIASLRTHRSEGYDEDDGPTRVLETRLSDNLSWARHCEQNKEGE